MAMSLYKFPFTMDRMVNAGFESPMVVRRRNRVRKSMEETKEEYVFCMMIPGVDKSGVEVELDREKVKIRVKGLSGLDGEVLEEKLTLPKRVDKDSISAEAKNGVLKIRMGKVAEEVAEKVDVREEKASSGDFYELTFEVPGATVEDLRVRTTSKRLFVDVSGGDKAFYKSFSRQYVMKNDADLHNSQVYYMNGIMTIQVPKKSSTEISIEDGKVEESDESVFCKQLPLPGVSTNNLRLSQIGNSFELEFYNSEDTEEKEAVLSFRIPEHVDLEHVKAHLYNGVMSVTAARMEPMKKIIPVLQ